MSPAVPRGPAAGPLLILAADHRARGVMTVEPYAELLEALRRALPHCDGILATAQPLGDLVGDGAVRRGQRTYLSVNRTGLAGAVFELDDRLVASVEAAAEAGYTGVKHMTRIDRTDPGGAAALELLGQVIDRARRAGLEALIEALTWRDGAMARDTDAVVAAAVIAHDLGAPLLKVPVPAEAPGAARVDAVARVVGAVGVPVLFLGGPRRHPGVDDPGADEALVAEVTDVMAGGGGGLAIGRTVFAHPDPGAMAARLAEVVHGR